MTYQSLETYIKRFLSCIVLGWVELTDGGISQWACGDGRQVITTWSHSRPTEQGMTNTVISDNYMSSKHI